MSKFSVITVLLLFSGISLYGQSGNSDYQYALIEAVKQKNLGNLPGAIELYKMVIKEEETVAVAHYELGTLYAVIGKTEEALQHLERAFNLDRENFWYFESYIDVLMLHKDFRKAIKLLKDKVEKETDDVNYLYKLANVYFLKDNSRKAIKTLERIEKKHGLADKITLLKANIYESEGKFSKAVQEIFKIIDLFPESIEFKVIAAELAMKSKDEELAIEFYKEVLVLDSLNIYALTNLTDYHREKEEYSESFYYLNKSFQSSEISYDKKMAILSYYLSDEFYFKNFNPELEMMIRTMLEKYEGNREIHLFGGDFFIQKRSYGEALNSILPILKEGESKYELWRQGILLADATDRKEEMLLLATKASKIFKDSTEIIFYKGMAEFELERYDKLIDTFDELGMRNTGNGNFNMQARVLLAESYYKLENYKVSDSLFRAIIDEEPANYIVMNNFSYYLSLRNESLEEAKALSNFTIRNNPENGTFLDTYAWILFKLENYEEAEKYIMKALNHGGENDPDVNEHAAEIHRAIGSLQLAIAFYRKAIILGGDKEKLMSKIEEIDDKAEF